MNKAKAITFIISGVVIAYIFLLAMWEVLTGVVADSSAIIGANPNLDQYIGAKEGLDVMPWVLFFLPAVIGIIAVIVVMKSPEA